MATSRVKAFYRLPLAERRAWLAAELGLREAELGLLLQEGGLDAERADQVVENVVGTYALPFCLGLNFQVDGRDRLVPMVVEEPSVVAAASNAAKMVRAGGGFVSEVDAPLMISQVQLVEVRDPEAAHRAILAAKDEILAVADRAVPGLVARGGGAR